MNLQFQSRQLGDKSAIIKLIGEADVFTLPAARQEMLKLIEEGVNWLIVDLEGIDYLDSTALGTLVGMLKRVRERSGELVLVGPKPRIRRLFEITRLEQVFSIYPDEKQAIESIEQEINGGGGG